jgi:hypothetical protein
MTRVLGRSGARVGARDLTGLGLSRDGLAAFQRTTTKVRHDDKKDDGEEGRLK